MITEEQIRQTEMYNSISIAFGTPKHGWLPVNFHHKDFHLNFDASDVLNDPIEEIYNVVAKLQDGEHRQVIWWLEPGAYFFDIEKKGQTILLTISETEDLHSENANKTFLHSIAGDNEQIINPFRIALKQFCLQTHEGSHWPYYLDKHRIEGL